MRAILVATLVFGAFGAPAVAQDFDPMQFADTNSDGKVTLEEYTVLMTGGWQFAASGADKVKLADLDPMMRPLMDRVPPDAEGYVTQAAFSAHIPTRFQSADKDSDGTLTGTELRASFGAPAG